MRSPTKARRHFVQCPGRGVISTQLRHHQLGKALKHFLFLLVRKHHLEMVEAQRLQLSQGFRLGAPASRLFPNSRDAHNPRPPNAWADSASRRLSSFSSSASTTARRNSDFSIVEKSRFSASQCWRRISVFLFTVSTEDRSRMFQPSACWATIRSMTFSPPPAIQIRGGCCMGLGAHSASCNW